MQPSLYGSILHYLTRPPKNGGKVTIAINKFGFVKGIEISDSIQGEDRTRVLEAVSKMTFLPKIEKGEAQPSTIRLNL